MKVVKAVHCSARDAKRIAWPDFMWAALQRDRQYAREAVDRFLVSVMTVRDRNLRPNRYVELKHGNRPTRCITLDQKTNRQLSDPDLFLRASHQ